MVEMLTVMAIIAILISLLIPAISMVRRTAKETRQKAQFAAIEMAIMAFKGDYGDYPPSQTDTRFGVSKYYCGAQKLAEALLGWDLLGFDPNSDWRYDGLDASNGPGAYDPYKVRHSGNDTLNERKGPYLETSGANAFRLSNLFGNTGDLDPNRFVICDSFGVKPVLIGGKTVKAGTPILYYKANTANKTIGGIYNACDNQPLVALGKMMNTGVSHPIVCNPNCSNYSNCLFFYDYDYKGGIKDPRITTLAWPYRPDSYILISAGLDGLYGTSDDITNFGQ